MDYYSKWVMTDPNKRMTYTGTDGTEGFAAAWDSNIKQAGKGDGWSNLKFDQIQNIKTNEVP